MLNRVVITGIGIHCSIGNTIEQVQDSLYQGKSGIEFTSDYQQKGFRSQISGTVEKPFSERIPRKSLRFMGDAAAYAWLSMSDAIADANLDPEQYQQPRVGLIVGSGGSSTLNIYESALITAENNSPKRIGPYRVPRTMSSSASACLSTDFGIKGINYSISSACATGAHCIGNAFELIQFGKQDMMFAGAGEELEWTQSLLFDAMGAMSSKYNDTPQQASRAYDVDRDGFVISGGGGIVVLESLEHAQARGAKIYAEIIGYGASSDGYDMVQPSGRRSRSLYANGH